MFEENWDDPNSPPISTYQQPQYKTSSKKYFKSFSARTSNSDEINWRSTNQDTRGDSDKRKPKSNSNRSTFMRVESSKIGKIIGTKGCQIKRLEEKSGANIKIGDFCEDDNYLRFIIISGSQESQEICKKLIEELVDEKPLTLVHNEPKETVPLIDWDRVNALAEEAEAKRWANCPPIKKNLYIEDPEVANMTEEEVKNFRIEKNNIIVKNVFGGNEKILNPVKTFAQAFQHYPEILREIEKQGFTDPSPIQCQAWPILLSGRDLIGIAQTGTGKTLAFILPALIHISEQNVSRSGGANVLIISPTREVALQLDMEVQKYSYKGIKSVCLYGGGDRRKQIDVVVSGVQIIIATPGRLNDLINSHVVNLKSITFLILDEADRLLDMGFEPQIRKVLLDIRPDRQSVMTSATWPSAVQCLAERYMTNPVQVYIGSLDLTAVHSVTQTVLVVKKKEKKEYLLDFINSLTEDDKVIIFVGKKVLADNLSCDLSLHRILCQSIHGNRAQEDREQALDDLKTGAVNILIATDVASRGLDILDITKVFNYDFPQTVEEYVHRIGRTGRAGKRGEAITLFTKSDSVFASELINIMEEANQPVPLDLYQMKYHFLIMQEKKKNNIENPANGRFKRSGGSRFDGFSSKDKF